ncbi:MAG: hypothetical protein ACI8QS_000948 [Planctomycetota bacterium]|jgi:hypothetical protein
MKLLELLLATALVVTPGCAGREVLTNQPAGEPVPRAGSDGAALAESYRFTLHGYVTNEAERIRSDMPFDAISLASGSTWGEGEFWRFGRDGSVFHRKEGKSYHGSLSLFHYGRLCHAAEFLCLLRLEDNYHRDGVDDGLSYTLRLWPPGAQNPKSITDYAGAGPSQLSLMIALIEGIGSGLSLEENVQHLDPADRPSDDRRSDSVGVTRCQGARR